MSSTARFDELKKKFDENPRRYFAPLANEFRKSGDAEQAVMICEEFLPQQPGHMSGHIVYGQALFDLGRLDDARTVFETALTLDPENLIALRHLGDIARAHGDLESARHWYQRVLEADPRNEEVQALIASLDSTPGAPAPAAAEPAAPAPAEVPFSAPVTTTFIEQSTTVELSPAFESPASAPPPLPEAQPHAEPLLELDFVEEHAIEPGTAGQAEGLESMEFTPPAPAAASGSGLADQLEPAEFSAPPSTVAPLEGLEETALGTFDTGAASASPPPLPDLEPLPVSPSARPTVESDASSAADELPVDIPPEVIAAEAELIDARELIPTAETSAPAEAIAADAPSPAQPVPSAMPTMPEIAGEAAVPPVPPRVTPSQPFVTETMAELYVKQGFREQALDVYKLLLAASPENQRLRDRVAELQPREDVDTGPNVREFFSRLAARRPGDAGASAVPPANDDFAALDSFETVPASTPVEATPAQPSASANVPPELAGLPMLDDGPEAESAPSPAPAPPEQDRGGGSIDALFGQRPVGQDDASAASALAQAFGSGANEPPAISGRPARAAAGELSLDSVFRDGGARPPRSAQSFSFDQFFSESATSEPAAESAPAPTPSQGTSTQAEPAERNADDIEQFNSWLQGLKQK
jgi:tetratricopeptide (TPR) repeat protein